MDDNHRKKSLSLSMIDRDLNDLYSTDSSENDEKSDQ